MALLFVRLPKIVYVSECISVHGVSCVIIKR